jgi:hypothetical protein
MTFDASPALSRRMCLAARFDARLWLSVKLGCDAPELALAWDQIDWAGRRRVIYYRNGSFAAELLISTPRTFLRSEPPHRLLTAEWRLGRAQVRIGASEDVVLDG